MIDHSRIAELRAELGDEDFTEIAALFISEVEDLINGLAGTQPGTELADALHRVRGSALNCGLSALAESCLAAETAQRRAPTPFCPIALQTLFRESVSALPKLG
ncbi:MAG: Hpt domain-containing protein [Pseudomonadota bacterium]